MTSSLQVLIQFLCHINPTHYVLIRSDLPLGFQAAQIVHAAGESALEPVQSGTNAVVLAVVSEAHLLEIAKKLSLAGVPHVLIREVDPPYEGQATAIGIVPVADRGVVKKYVQKLKLL